MIRALAVGAALAWAAVAPPAEARAAAAPPEIVERGRHWRVGTPQGTVHVWCPEAYDPRTAGTVVYVHGYFDSADSAWAESHLAAQFRESRQNALYVVPEAPSSGDDPVLWPTLGRLLATVHAETGLARPPGPVVVVGHSGAWRTLEPWLRERTVGHVILLDALYGPTSPFRAWLRAARSRSAQLVVVAVDTMGKAAGLLRGLRGVVRLSSVPESTAAFPRSARRARVVLLRSQYEHMAMVSEGKVIPVVLPLTTLVASDPAYRGRPTRSTSAAKRGSPRRPSTHGSTRR